MKNAWILLILSVVMVALGMWAYCDFRSFYPNKVQNQSTTSNAKVVPEVVVKHPQFNREYSE